MDVLSEFVVGYSLPVDVTHINDPHSFFVRSSKVRDFIDTIESPGSVIPAKMIQVGQRVVFKSNLLRKYVRGEIRFINKDGEDTACGIFAIDYGCFEKHVLLESICSLDKMAEPENQCPALAIHCRLYLCEPRGGDVFTENVIDTMKSYVDEHTANITIISKIHDQFVVELRTVECPRDIAMMMGLLDLTTFTRSTNTINRFSHACVRPQLSSSALNSTQTLKYKYKELKVGDMFHVRIQSGNSLSGFNVAELNDYKNMIYSQPDTTRYFKELKPMLEGDIVPGRPCAVSVGVPPKYERALIKQVLEKESKAVLQLVDWGTDIETNISCIKPMVSEIYFDKPIVAIYCSTDQETVWETDLTKFLSPGNELVIKIMTMGNGFIKPHKVHTYPYIDPWKTIVIIKGLHYRRDMRKNEMEKKK